MAPSTELDNCWFCGGPTHMTDDPVDVSIFVKCFQCLAQGPKIDAKRPDAVAQAVAAWGAGRKFGRLAVAPVPGGMPTYTCSLAERLRLIAEGIYKGEYGEPDCGIVMLKKAAHVTTVTHNITDSDTARVLRAVHESARIRSAVVPKS